MHYQLDSALSITNVYKESLIHWRYPREELHSGKAGQMGFRGITLLKFKYYTGFPLLRE